jgi:hypothetical protein
MTIGAENPRVPVTRGDPGGNVHEKPHSTTFKGGMLHDTFLFVLARMRLMGPPGSDSAGTTELCMHSDHFGAFGWPTILR